MEEVILEMQNWFSIQKSINGINRPKEKSHMNISIQERKREKKKKKQPKKAFDKPQQQFIKASQTRKRRNFLTLIKGNYKKPTANIVPNCENLKAFS